MGGFEDEEYGGVEGYLRKRGRQKEEDGRNRIWEGEKYGKKRRMGEKGAFEDGEDFGNRVI